MRKRKEKTMMSCSSENVAAQKIGDGDDELPAGGKGGFFACYLLTSLSPRYKGHTYIGFTVNPKRRIRQHNGEIRCGAWRTKRKRPWEMVMCIYGFATNVSALQFEWAWQHPKESLAVRKAAAELKSLSGVANKIKLAYTMLTLPSWQSLVLTLTIDVHSSSALESYHVGARAAVPFLWESQPGTPKHRLRQAPLPPLTPPPSYFFKSASATPARKQKFSTRAHPSNAVLSKLNFIKRNNHHAVRLLSPAASSGTSTLSLSSPSSLSSCSPSAHSSSPATPLCDYYYSRRYGFTFEAAAEEKEHLRSSLFCCSPISCFGSEKRHRRSNNGRRSSSGAPCSSILKRLIS
uniref:Structure-specific endonuclease subunit SLX1 homolog n=1 Tax=Kalanchoe fedtschenkoi TaxID=63787 RepID=A0A7N0TGT7_KALFE